MLAEPSQGSHSPAWELGPFTSLRVPVAQGEESASPCCQLSSQAGGSWSPRPEVGRTKAYRLLSARSLGLLGWELWGSGGGGLGGERKPVFPFG